MANDNENQQQQQQTDDASSSSSSGSSTSSNSSSSDQQYQKFGFFNSIMIDPLQFSTFLFVALILFVVYLLLPRGIRKQYFYAHPKRHAWTARSNSTSSAAAAAAATNSMQSGSHNTGSSSHLATGGSSSRSVHPSQQQQQQQQRGNVNTPIGLQSSMETGSYTGGSSILGSGTAYTAGSASAVLFAQQQQQQGMMSPSPNMNMMGLTGTGQQQQQQQQPGGYNNSVANENNEIVISAAMQQLRDPGVLIVAHGSRGKPKTVRLSLTETSITWRTETRKLNPTTNATGNKPPAASQLPKMGKLHSVPLAHIMYVDVGKQTTALRRVENASVPDVLCFSLLTKEGSLDLEAASSRERDALVSCFSLVLDEVHSAQNWRDIYRGPSSDMPSSFDEFDNQNQLGK